MRNGNLESEEQDLTNAFHEGADVERDGKWPADAFHDRAAAVRLWTDILDTCKVKRSVLAAELDMSEGYFSKVSAGVQGDLLGLVYQVGRKYPKLRRAFINGLAEIENADPLAHAAELLAVAAMRFLRLQGEHVPLRMARASMSEERKRGIA